MLNQVSIITVFESYFRAEATTEDPAAAFVSGRATSLKPDSEENSGLGPPNGYQIAITFIRDALL